MTLKSKFKKRGVLLPFLIPSRIVTIICCYIPMCGILFAFKDRVNLFIYDPFEAFVNANWTLEHFSKIFSGNEFLRALGNTLLISFLKIIFVFPLPIVLAIFICDIKIKWCSKLFQACMYLPYFLSWAVVSGIFMDVLSSYGVVNRLLISLGIMDKSAPFIWFQEASCFPFLVVFTDAWKGAGYGTSIYIAAIIGINTELYDATKIDGATKLQRIVHITLPGIKNTIVAMFIFRICYMMDAGFDQIYTMLTPALEGKWQIIGTYVYNIGIKQANYTFSTAVGVFNSVVALILILTGNYISKKFVGRGII